jgi:hypothetical protein
MALTGRKFITGLSFIFLFLGAFGQVNPPIAGVKGVGSGPLKVTVAEIVAIDEQMGPQSNLRINGELKAGNRFKTPSPDALPGNRFPLGNDLEAFPMNVTQAVHSNFQGVQLSEAGSIPPDCMGDVSHTQICVLTNGRIKFYPKPTICEPPLLTSINSNTGSLTGTVFNTSLSAFFSGVVGSGSVTDPHIYFDRQSERWFVVAISTANASNRILIAVSNSSTVTAQSSFNFFFFNHDNGAPANSPDRGAFCDFPMLGLDKHALYIGGIIFNSSGNFIGSSVYVVNKASLAPGSQVQFTAFRQVGLVNSGIFAPQGVYNDDPEATRGFFMGVDNEVFGRLSYIVVNNPGGASPTITQGTINVPATYYPYDQPAQGSTVALDALGDERLLDAQMIRNKISGQNSIWTAHHIAVNASGSAVTAAGVANARNAMRWYQLAENNGVLSLAQSGTLFDNAATGAKGYWMGTIAASGQGHAVLGSSMASPTLHANAIAAGRYAPQTAGILNPPVNVTNFTAVYNRETSGEEQRWGDYSHTVVDPSDDMTIWTFQEYTNSTNNWGLRAVQLKAPPPAVPTGISPIVCDGLGNATVTLTGSATDFAGFFDPGPPRGGPAYPRRLSVSSTGNVIISAVELLSATQIRFLANLSNAQLGSQQTLTITNPDCQSVTFNYNLPANCGGGGPNPGANFSVNQNPVVGNMLVKLPEATGNLRLLASDGKLVQTYLVTNRTMNIATSGYVSGVYFLEYVGNNGSETIKIVIQ